MRALIFLAFLLLGGQALRAQYATKHFIAPSPWQYWSDANEIVISTKEELQVNAEIYKSDGTFITTLELSSGSPVSYRFEGEPDDALRNILNIIYQDRGLIIVATAPVLVNVRNIASDSGSTSNLTIKGNASLVSFGNEGIGTSFRLGYYRSNYTGINTGAPVYSVMAIENATQIRLNSVELVNLESGESFLFNAEMGALLTSDKPVVANTGTYGDTPQACSGMGEDGAVDQIAPVNQLGLQYMLVRGNGTPGVGAAHPEQSTIIASEPDTNIIITNFTPQGTEISSSTEILTEAGDFINLFHGDTQNPYSSTYILANKPVIVYSASAVGCETDISTVLPIGGCSGTRDVSTRKFIGYDGEDLPYFGYVILESATDVVYVNGQNMEIITGMPRTEIGNTNFYMLRFTDTELQMPESIHITSQSNLTTSIIQQGSGFSMSGFFSAFSNAPDPPSSTTADNCTITLSTLPGLEPYEWYIDGSLVPGEVSSTIVVAQTGNYSVKASSECGITPMSAPVYAAVAQPIQAGLAQDMVQCADTINDNLFVLTTQNNAILPSQSPEEYKVTYHTSQEDAISGTNSITEIKTSSNLEIYARVTNNLLGCYAVTSFSLMIVYPEINMPEEYYFCIGGTVSISAPEGFLSYNWSTGETTQNITVSSASTIALTVTQEINGIVCQANKSISVIESSMAEIIEVLVTDWTNNQNTIRVVTAKMGDFNYSLDGVNYQDDPVFYNIQPGLYTVYARNKHGCGITQYDAHVLMYPTYFTPNGDGWNEMWKIRYSYLEPEMSVYIFDRYGKLLTSFTGSDAGWDGTLQGYKLPASDYWFLVKRKDGKIHRGHFSLLR